MELEVVMPQRSPSKERATMGDVGGLRMPCRRRAVGSASGCAGRFWRFVCGLPVAFLLAAPWRACNLKVPRVHSDVSSLFVSFREPIFVGCRVQVPDFAEVGWKARLAKQASESTPPGGFQGRTRRTTVIVVSQKRTMPKWGLSGIRRWAPLDLS